jgi:hypothetical protein
MAQIKQEQLYQADIYKNLIDSAKLAEQATKELDTKVVALSKSFAEIAKQTVKLDSKSIQALNKAYEGSTKTLEKSIKIDKLKLEAQTKLEQLRQQQLKSKIQQEALDQKVVAGIIRETKETERLVREQEKQARASEKQSRASEILNNAFKKLERSTNEARDRFRTLAAEQGLNSKATIQARQEFERLDGKLRAINTLAKDGKNDVGRYGIAFNGLKSSLSDVAGAFGIGTAIALVGASLRDAFNTIKDFEFSLSNLQAVLGVSKAEMKSLNDEILRLGNSTKFSAQEVANAATELAKLGFTANEIEASLEGVLNGAIALGAEIPDVAELTSKTIRAFGLTAEDTERVVSTLAASANKTATGFEFFADSLPYASTAAKQLGFSIEQTATFLGVLADNGLKSSTAGVSLRDIFTDLSVKGLTLNQALDKIKKSTDKSKTAFELFGKTSSSAAIILADNKDKFEDLTKAITGQEEALQKLVEVRSDNLQGDIEKLSSAWDGFILGVVNGEGALGSFFRSFTQGTTSFISNLNRVSLTTKVLLGNFKNLTTVDFKSFTESFRLDNGKDISVFLKETGFELDKLTKAFNNTKASFGEQNGIKFFKSKETEQLIFVNKLQKDLTASLVAQGEKLTDAATFSRKYIELLKEEAKNKEALKTETKENIIINEDEAEGKKRLTGLIEKQEDKIRKLNEALKESKRIGAEGQKGTIRQIQAEIEVAQIELDRLLGRQKEVKTEAVEAPKDFTEERVEALRKLRQTELDIAANQKLNENQKLEAFKKSLSEKEAAEIEALQFSFDNQRDAAKQTIDDEITLTAELERIELERGEALADIKDKNSNIIKEKEKEALQERLELQQAGVDLAAKLFQKSSEKTVKAIDQQLNDLSSRADSLRQSAALGNAESVASLALADKKQAELNAQKEKELKKQKQIEAGLAAYKVFAAKTEAGDKNALGSTLKELLSLDAFVAALPTFYSGADHVGSAMGAPHLNTQKDAYIARVDKNERIVDPTNAALIGYNTPNSLVGEVMSDFRRGFLTRGDSVAPPVIVNMQGMVVKELQTQNELLKKLPNMMPRHSTDYDTITKIVSDIEKRNTVTTVRRRKL